MADQAPTVGRVVHYVSHGTPPREDGSQAYAAQCRAAIVTAVPVVDGHRGAEVALCVLNPTGLFFREAAQDEDDHEGGTWHWPERA